MNKKLKILLYIVIFGLGFWIGNLISYYMREQLSSQEAPNNNCNIIIWHYFTNYNS